MHHSNTSARTQVQIRYALTKPHLSRASLATTFSGLPLMATRALASPSSFGPPPPTRLSHHSPSSVRATKDSRLMHMTCEWMGRAHFPSLQCLPALRSQPVRCPRPPILPHRFHRPSPCDASRGQAILLGDFNFTDDWTIDKANKTSMCQAPPPPHVSGPSPSS